MWAGDGESLEGAPRWVLAWEQPRTPQAVESARELFGLWVRVAVLLHTFPRNLFPLPSQGPCPGGEAHGRR